MPNGEPSVHAAPRGVVLPRDLADARIALHLAAQPLAAAAYALLPMRADHAHATLLWSRERNGFVGRELGGGLRGFLDPANLSLGLLGKDGAEGEGVALSGLTLDGALEAFGEVARGSDLPLSAEGLRLPEYDLDPSAILAGAAFPDPPVAALTELSEWFGFGTGILDELSRDRLDGAEVRVWPHHFDAAALRTLDTEADTEADPESARSVGAGLSPGDGSYAEPYFYVTPWPAPSPADLPELPGRANWHTDGFTSAILTATDVLADGAETPARTRATLRSSVEACLRIVGA